MSFQNVVCVCESMCLCVWWNYVGDSGHIYIMTISWKLCYTLLVHILFYLRSPFYTDVQKEQRVIPNSKAFKKTNSW